MFLEAYIQVCDGEMDRKTAITAVSNALRKRAELQGEIIDGIFRNEAGITFQMYSMESAYLGYTVRKPATRLFSEVVKLRKENKTEYDRILRRIKALLDTDKSLEEKFVTWLSARVSPAQLSELYMVVPSIDEFCLSRKILKQPLLKTDDLTMLANVRNTIEGNRVFRFSHKRQVNKMSVIVRHYINFIKEKKEQQEAISEFVDAEEDSSVANVIETEAIVHTDKTYIAQNTGNSINAEERKREFQEWMIAKGMAITTVRPYVSSLGLCGKMAQDNGIIDRDIYTIDDSNALKEIFDALMKNEEFLKKNDARHNQFRSAFAKYVQFASDLSFVSTVVYGRAASSAKSEELNDSDEEIKRDNSELYMRLRSMSKVYDDVNGFSLMHIDEMLGMPVELDTLRDIMERISWITKVGEDIYSFSKYAKPYERLIEFDQESFIRVLMMRYQNGMRFDSIDLENFRETYSDIAGETILLSDEDLEKCLKKCGVLYKDRIFPAAGIINETAKEKLISYIENSFAEGKKVIYYKAVFSDLSDVFAYCFNLTDPLMLKPYLEYVCEPDEYYFFEEYLSKEADVKVDHTSEIEDYLLSVGKPLSYGDIYSGLSHISQDIIYSVIKTNSNIVLNEREHYFHYGIFEFSSEEADQISIYISDEIDEEGYCIWSRIYETIKENMPLFIENNVYLSALGIRNAVAKKLAGRFNFDGEVICARGQALNMAAVYRLYGQHHVPFSDIEIYEFSKEVSGGAIYFDSLADVAVRVNRELFVAVDQVEFDVEATDKALSTYLTTGYMPVKDVDSYLVFPNVGYEWNTFLLESYLMYYSKDYALCNNGKSLNNVAGAVVKRGSGFDEFEDVCADVLAKGGIDLTRNKALDYLAEQNMLTRRSYKGIERAIAKARQIRNKKG